MLRWKGTPIVDSMPRDVSLGIDDLITIRSCSCAPCDQWTRLHASRITRVSISSVAFGITTWTLALRMR